MSVSYRKYPSMALEEAVTKLNKVYEDAGRGPSAKNSYIKGLGYTSVSGASSSAFAALMHYGFIEKVGQNYKISDLGMHILRPADASEETRIGYMQEAALAPNLFKDIYEKYVGDKLPTLLENTLIHDFDVYDKSGKDAAEKFKQTLEFAGLLRDGVVENMSDKNQAKSVINESSDVFSENLPQGINSKPNNETTYKDDTINRIEIVLREGVKAGIFAPYKLTEQEKIKLKAIIDLL